MTESNALRYTRNSYDWSEPAELFTAMKVVSKHYTEWCDFIRIVQSRPVVPSRRVVIEIIYAIYDEPCAQGRAERGGRGGPQAPPALLAVGKFFTKEAFFGIPGH